MPRKVRQIVADLRRAGFILIKGGKGSHRKFEHSSGVFLHLSGKDGDDAKPYQEKDAKKKIEETQR